MYQLHGYQDEAAQFIIDRLENHVGAGLFLDMGMGKTLITLDVLSWFKSIGHVKRALIVGPLRVMGLVWPKEIEKWGFDMSYTILHGRNKAKKLRENTDLYITNHDSIYWLSKEPKQLLDFDLIVVDESTAFKNPSSKRTKALIRLLKTVKKRIILTGTPAPNSHKDLYSQMLVVDNGASLGRTQAEFRARFLQQGGFKGREWLVRDGAADQIDRAIADKVIWMCAADHLDMPRLVHNNVLVQLPPKVRAEYDRLEKEMFVELEQGTVEALAPASKYQMCKSIANGGLYQTDEFGERTTHHMHNAKTDALKEIIDNLNGKPALVLYAYNHDLDRLTEAFPKAPVINGASKLEDTKEVIAEWQTGAFPVLLAQPQAMSHGVDGLQGASQDIIWYGLSDRNEVVLQANARIYRQGNEHEQVRIHHIVADKTVDEAIVARLKDKTKGQQALLDALTAYRERKQNAGH